MTSGIHSGQQRLDDHGGRPGIVGNLLVGNPDAIEVV